MILISTKFQIGQKALEHPKSFNLIFFKLNKFCEIFFSLKKLKCLECPETLKTAKKYILFCFYGTGPRKMIFLGLVALSEGPVPIFWDRSNGNWFMCPILIAIKIIKIHCNEFLHRALPFNIFV